MKKCSACGAMKPLSDYATHPGCTDGHVGQCRACYNERHRERRAAYRRLMRSPEMVAKAVATPRQIEGFWRRVDKSGGPDACWPWTGFIRKSDGYGHLHFRGKMRMCHLIACELVGRDKPPKLFADHMCRVRKCVNPAHIRFVTPGVNTLENNDNWAAKNKRKTHCPKCDKPYAGENLAMVPRKTKGRKPGFGRVCLTCYPWYWKYAVVPRPKPPAGYSVKR